MQIYSQPLTVALKVCSACSAQLIASYRFCRLCGADQGLSEFTTKRLSVTATLDSNASALAPNNERKPRSPTTRFRSISGFILNSLATSNLPLAPSWIKSRIARKAVTAVIALPLWLMIVLLSPFDALEASRQLTRQL